MVSINAVTACSGPWGRPSLSCKHSGTRCYLQWVGKKRASVGSRCVSARVIVRTLVGSDPMERGGRWCERNLGCRREWMVGGEIRRAMQSADAYGVWRKAESEEGLRVEG